MLFAIIFAAAQFNSLGYPCTQYCDAVIVPGYSCSDGKCTTTGDKCAPGWIEVKSDHADQSHEAMRARVVRGGALSCRPEK